MLFSQIDAACQYDTVPLINDEEAFDFFGLDDDDLDSSDSQPSFELRGERVGRAKVPVETLVMTERSAMSAMTAAKAMRRRLVMAVLRRTLEKAPLTVEVVEDDMGEWRRRGRGGDAAGTGKGRGRGGGRTTGAGREQGGG